MSMEKTLDTSTPELRNAVSLIRFTHHSLFLTGKAGTGKSTFLRYVVEQKWKKSVVLAPTGIAAINAGGSTLHSFFKLPFHPLLPDDPRFAPSRLRDFLKYRKNHIKLLNEVELIIIDEISMVRADIIDFIDRVLRVFCRNMREPFGGKQVMLIGDVFQLEPVVKSDEWEILSRFYPNPYFFSARVFREMRLVSIELKKVFRQKDAGFIAALDHIRANQVSEIELQLLNTRHEESPKRRTNDELNILLATRRDNVDHVNQEELERLPGKAIMLQGRVEGEFPETSLPTLLQLEVKEGAQIIFIKNDPEKRWVNGTLGILTHIDTKSGTLGIRTDDGREVIVEPERWSNMRYEYNEREKRIVEKELGTFTQFPIRLAWAITIHKSQGLTFPRVTIDFSGGTFAGGQAYVALSRCTSLEGLTLCRPLQRSDIFVRPEVVEFARHFNDGNDLQRALQTAKADTEYAAAAQAFDKGDMKECLDHFFVAIHARYDIEKPAARRLLQRKLNIVNRLRGERDEMRRRMEAQNKELQALAREFVALGDECVTQAHNDKAAVANYTKALRLHPTSIDALVRRADTLMHMNQHHEAMHDLNEAVRLAPSSFKAIFNRGRAFMELNLWSEAINDLQRATSLKPQHPRAYQLLGDAHARLGDEETAAMYWQLAEELKKKGKRS